MMPAAPFRSDLATELHQYSTVRHAKELPVRIQEPLTEPVRWIRRSCYRGARCGVRAETESGRVPSETAHLIHGQPVTFLNPIWPGRCTRRRPFRRRIARFGSTAGTCGGDTPRCLAAGTVGELRIADERLWIDRGLLIEDCGLKDDSRNSPRIRGNIRQSSFIPQSTIRNHQSISNPRSAIPNS